MIKLFTLILVLVYTLFAYLIENKTKNLPFVKSEPYLNADTSRIFYYSFRDERVINLSLKNDILKNEKLVVYSGTNVSLEAPIYFTNALYLWEGPAGFRSYSQNVVLENVNTNQSGIYTVSVKKNTGSVSGKIELTVLDKKY